MARKRLTQIFPFLIPIRQKQRTFCFYLTMKMDRHTYAHSRSERPLPYVLHHAQFPLINYESGYDLVYQQNKVHNLKLVAQTMDGLLIRPGETFSFWQQGGTDQHRVCPGTNGPLYVRPGLQAAFANQQPLLVMMNGQAFGLRHAAPIPFQGQDIAIVDAFQHCAQAVR